MNLNKVFLLGRLTQDPQKKEFSSGQIACTFGLATNRYWKNKEGKRKEETEFHNIIVFGKWAENALKYLKKGSLVFVEGRIRTRSWEGEGGEKKQKTEIVAERLLLGPKLERELPQIEEKEEIPIIEDEINLEDIPF